MTVSRALRTGGMVGVETRALVEKVARKLGYIRNPLAGALMSEMRRSRTRAFQGVLAVLDIDGPSVDRPPGPAAYHAELAEGAITRAREMGFSADLVTMGAGELSVGRVDSILRARGIRGVFILPVREQPELSRLDWSSYSGIYADYLIEHPRLHCVCPDHYRAVLTAVERLRLLGYRRPGLVLSAFSNARLLHRQTAAFREYVGSHEDMEWAEPLLMWKPSRERFIEWFRASGCDAVVSHMPEAPAWMAEAGARVPETHGFCLLNVKNSQAPCAGLDLQPRLIGERSMEMLISMLLRNERGAPDQPMTTLIPARWMAGPTLRDLRGPGAVAPVSGVWKWAPPVGRRSGEYPPEGTGKAATAKRERGRR